jgi:hypothetical protein
MEKASRPKTSASKQPDRNVRRQRATAQNLAKGMTVEKAMLDAGYSPSYAHDQGYKAIKRPCIQSVFTDSCERILAKRQMQFDELVEPYFDGLKAKVIVKSQQLGDAQETEFPDHALRMNAADRLVDLYGGKPGTIEMPAEQPKGLTIIIQREASAKVPVVVNPTGRTSIIPEGETKHPKLPVTFVKPNGST